MNVTLKPISDHPTVQMIERSVSKLSEPTLEPLLGVFLDIKRGLSSERNALRQKINETEQEGWQAAARLMAPTQAQLLAQPKSYFETIEQKRRR